MSTCKVQCVNILYIYLLRDVYFPHVAYLGLEFHYGNSNMRIGTTIQKRRDYKFLFLKDSKILGSESNFCLSSTGGKHSGVTKKLSFLNILLRFYLFFTIQLAKRYCCTQPSRWLAFKNAFTKIKFEH